MHRLCNAQVVQYAGCALLGSAPELSCVQCVVGIKPSGCSSRSSCQTADWDQRQLHTAAHTSASAAAVFFIHSELQSRVLCTYVDMKSIFSNIWRCEVCCWSCVLVSKYCRVCGVRSVTRHVSDGYKKREQDCSAAGAGGKMGDWCDSHHRLAGTPSPLQP